MERKGFTLVELLVVIAIIALLMGILMPALARVRQLAYRLYCGTNLSGIGKAILVYANDYDGELPKAGGPVSSWGPTANWLAGDRANAFNMVSGPGAASISACFYALVRYADVTPKSFLCKGDSGATEFKPSLEGAGVRETIDLWDFGRNPQTHCSYSYHLPYGPYGLTSTSDPGLAVAADPNPWQQTGAGVGSGKDVDRWNAYVPTGDREQTRHGNSTTHQDDGQNVLFADGHTALEKTPSCGVDGDNIYTIWFGANKMKGKSPAINDRPVQRTDSFLVTDGAFTLAGH